MDGVMLSIALQKCVYIFFLLFFFKLFILYWSVAN